MCGILVALAKTGPIDAALCRRALATMYWRGPDLSFSEVWDGRLFLGQTVLSITGRPPHEAWAHQRSASGRCRVLYNGEIYNFSQLDAELIGRRPDLRSRFGTDTEVLANLHEVSEPEQVPPRLDGMYAYVVFDEKTRQLHVARDIQGEKSLYVYEDSQWVVIASELRAIRALIPEIAVDAQVLRDYFRTRHLMGFERTVYRGIRQILPGWLETLHLETLQWRSTQTQRLRDWIDPETMRRNALRSPESLVEELEVLLARCVREMLPRDRQYAAVVSGGVDSSLLAYYLVTQGDPELLIAVNHVGKDLISNDLMGFERCLGRPIHIVRVDAAAYASEIGRCQQACGAPLHSHSFIGQALQSARVREAGCRVLFGGDGADEWFGGYDAYRTIQAANGRFSPSPYMTHAEPRVAFLEDAPDRLLQDLASAWRDALEAYAFVERPDEQVTQAMTYCDAVYQLPEVGLRGADLMSMAWSVETRSVYLRRPVIQFALNLPASLKTNRDPGCPPRWQAKWLLKQVFLRHFPAELLAEKQGFAGFPNESAVCLGAPEDYQILQALGIAPGTLPAAWADRATAWKLINTEFFLRSGGRVSADLHDVVAVR